MFGYVIYFAGGPIAFASKRIKVVAKSSAEAEYAAAAYACMELTFVRNILGDLGYPVQAPVIVCVDNKAAVDICKSLGVTKRSKHFTDAIHYFRRCYFHKEIFPILVDTHNQCADGFTKPLEKVKFKPWCSRILRLK